MPDAEGAMGPEEREALVRLASWNGTGRSDAWTWFVEDLAK